MLLGSIVEAHSPAWRNRLEFDERLEVTAIALAETILAEHKVTIARLHRTAVAVQLA